MTMRKPSNHDTPRPWDAYRRQQQTKPPLRLTPEQRLRASPGANWPLPDVHTRCGDCGSSIIMVVGGNVTKDEQGRIVARCMSCREQWGKP